MYRDMHGPPQTLASSIAVGCRTETKKNPHKNTMPIYNTGHLHWLISFYKALKKYSNVYIVNVVTYCVKHHTRHQMLVKEQSRKQHRLYKTHLESDPPSDLYFLLCKGELMEC